MKSLILKDIYNICHDLRSLLAILLIFAFLFVISSQIGYYVFVSVFICGMMVISTFTFDKQSNWHQYAMVMPISKKDIVVGKYLLLLILTAVGAVFGWITGTVGGMILGEVACSPEGIGEMLFAAWVSFLGMLIVGSMSIILVFKFGPERGRLLIMISGLIPAGIGFFLFELLDVLGIVVMVRYLLWASPLLVPALCYWMYRISYRIFSNQEL